MMWIALILVLPLIVLAAWMGARNRGVHQVTRERTLEEILVEEKVVRRKSMPPLAATPTTVSMPDDLTVDEARLALQKVAYGMVGSSVSDDDKLKFKQVMTEFAAADPLVHGIVEQAQRLVAASPGQLQSKIYVHFPRHDKEQVRYALYFAHELGLIYRKKKGNSYQLFPPGNTIDM